MEFKVGLYNTFDELKQQIIKILKLPDNLFPFIGFYEVNETDGFYDENFIEDFVRISDVIASWEYLYYSNND